MKNQCNEIFSFFQTVDDLRDTREKIAQTLFLDYSNKDLFELFKKQYACNYSNIVYALSYSFYLCCLWLQKDISNALTEKDIENLFSQYSSETQNQILFGDAFEMISIFYTCESLLKNNLYYQYSDFKDIFSSNMTYYEACFGPKSNMTFYRAAKSATTATDQSNHTRALRNDAANSIFYEALNYRTDIQNEKKVLTYYLNGFLPKLTLLLCEKSSRHTEKTFDVQKDYQFPTPLKQLFDDFYEIASKVYDAEDVLSNILNFYKLELSFGFFTSIAFFSSLGNSPWNLENTLTSLSTRHALLNPYSPLRYSPYSQNVVPIDNPTLIIMSKFIFALLYDLYDDKLDVLHKELGDCILQFYSRNDPDCILNYLAPHDMNCWHIMHYIFKNTSQESKVMHFEMLNTKYKQLQKSERLILFKYLERRYSKEWIGNLKKLFQTKLE